ncbi:MAG: PQQ-dependent sugar dehydrogenase [Trueperaceae bacterium]
MKLLKLRRSVCILAVLLATHASANTPPLPEGLTLTPFVAGLEMPVYIAAVPGQANKQYVLEKGGRVRLVENGEVQGQPVLDIQNLVSTGLEQGLLGIALHPDYQSNGYIFVNYTDEAGDTQIVRYQVSNDVADPDSAKTILTVDQPHSNHNSGTPTFGPDGYLYIVMGDGGSQGDPDGNGQNMGSLLGKMLRIDVDNGDPYSIPDDNPFVGQEGVLPEIWTSGWRNPWRFSFDRETGDMWIADVGQNAYEEINFQLAGQGGGNYGWRCYEASHEYDLSENCEGKEFIDPVLEYDHSQGASVTGGYMYRGSAIPDLQGRYVFGDFTSGKIWFASSTDNGWVTSEWQDSDLNISSFGEDADGELFVIDYSGTIYRLEQE